MIRPLGVDHAAINVRDLARSLEFYTRVLGLEVSQREHQKPGVEYFLDCGTSLIGLIQGDPSGPEHPLRHEGVGGNHVAFRVHARDFDGAVESLRSAGAVIDFVKKRDRSWSCYFKDPDGNKLELTAWPLEDDK